MNTDLRRSKRYNDFIPVSVLAKNEASGNKEVGPFAGRIINISRHGACLLMSLGVIESYDVYRSTYKNDGTNLVIEGAIPPGLENFSLSGNPVWMDPFVLDDIRAFKMGVEFKDKSDHDQSDNIIENITAGPSDDDLFEIPETT